MTQRWHRDPDHVSSEIDGALVIFSAASGKYLSLNASARVVWEALTDPVTVDALANALVARFRVDEATAADAVRTVLEQLTGIGVVTAQR